MRAIQNQTKIVQFEDNYLEAFFPDGTSMAWLNDSITYYSLKGNRIKVSIETLKHSEDVSHKITKVVQCQNKFNDEYIELPKHLKSSAQAVFKKYKIKEFTWNNPTVRSTDRGYEVVSDDNSARCWLSHDLYRLNVEYLQLTSNREVSKEELYLGAKNQRKLLLQKYSCKYNQFPTNGCTNEIEYEYHLITKQFTIFNLPPRWYPPIKLIWGYILANQLIPHPFCYIDFLDAENKQLASIETSKMPQFMSLEDYKQYQEEDKALDASTYPLFGKPNHNFKFKWMWISQSQVDLIGYACQESNIICQREGFWFIEGSKVIYNSKNKDKVDYEVSLNAFPITVRFQSQTPRSLKSYIIAFNNYLQHRDLMIQKQKNKVTKKVIESDSDIIHEEILEGIGIFKAFRNHMVKGNFNDRVIVTIRDVQIKVIDAGGKWWIVGNDPVLSSRFGWHIDQLSNFYQKVFDPQAYQSRMQLNHLLQERKQLSNVFLQVTKHIQSNDY